MSDEKIVHIQTVLMSVSDKRGLVDFAKRLLQINPKLQIIATGNTAKTLQAAGCSITLIEDYTKFPECFNGRVKTLHPKIEGGILFRRGVHDAEAETLDIQAIDMVLCNLYDFASAAQDKEMAVDDLIEQMDIGGSTLIRSSAKNHRSVSIVVSPEDYQGILNELGEKGGITQKTRERLAVKAVNLSADYEALIAQEFSRRLGGEETRRICLHNGKALRYGENPDQDAWVFSVKGQKGVVEADVLNGKPLSYNNLEDASIAFRAAQELYLMGFAYSVAVVKHGGICGYASGQNEESCFESAWAGDPKSAFGSVIACGHELTDKMIPCLSKRFVELLIAPSFSETLLKWIAEKKPNLRVLRVDFDEKAEESSKSISGGVLVQTTKKASLEEKLQKLMEQGKETDSGVMTRRIPTEIDSKLLGFSLAAVKYVKSNALALTRKDREGNCQVLSVGGGQPNRIDSLERLAIPKAIENLEAEYGESINLQEELGRCLLASDGFFPFADSIEYAASVGIRHIVQPGGSVRDAEVLEAANRYDMSMIFTRERYFTH
ncbi:MAG: bifunctional phosphoribosylaminoimidazolecarboxamide formyltransferase/IMP cyclohydrolase PurH [Waddliaceae bacterium]|nr:bifunctional phosphoribosylaminoimidazolecarboxamide formyltransferase/IMP cyclohydrolase PurH [Waddliaceae bacterium]